MADLGQSFSPFSDNGTGQNGQPSGVDPVQEVIKLLSLRMPRVVGASPSPLLGARTGGQGSALRGGIAQTQGLPGQDLGNNIAENWLRALFSGQSPMSSPQSGGQDALPNYGRLPAGVVYNDQPDNGGPINVFDAKPLSESAPSAPTGNAGMPPGDLMGRRRV